MVTPDLGATEPAYLGRSAKRVLIASFGVLLALLVVAGVASIATLANIRTQEEAARADFLSRTDPLVQIRSNLTLYGDALQKPVTAGEARQLAARIRSDLAQYPQARAPEEQSLIDHLQVMLADQDRVCAEMLALRDSQRMNLALGSEVLPSHLRVIAATEQITLWNHHRFRSVNAELGAAFDRLRHRLQVLLFCLLGSGLAIALGSIVLIAAQEKEIRNRYSELSKSHAARTQLSARLLEVQEQERRSISRELHDEVGQSLGALLVDMGRLSSILPPDDWLVRAEVAKMRGLAESSVSAVRNIALLLRPSMLDDLGLVAAIEWQAREVSRRSEVEVEVHAPDLNQNLPENLKTCLYRITQEALNNIVRHSGARCAWVNLHVNNGQVEEKIRDNGSGFDPQRSRGLGILGMEERVRLLNGSLIINSTPGAGTEITVRLPVN